MTLWTIARQAPLSMGFSRQECWRGLPFPPPGDLPNSGIKTTSLASPALTGEFFTTSTTLVLSHLSCLMLCNPMDCSTPGLPVPHHFLEFAQVHLHCIGDAIQLAHPRMPSSHSTLNLSQHQGLFHWVNCLYQMTKILEFQFQHQSFQWVFRVDFP